MVLVSGDRASEERKVGELRAQRGGRESLAVGKSWLGREESRMYP